MGKSRNNRRNTKPRNNRGASANNAGKSKEVEVNIKDSQLNKQDLPCKGSKDYENDWTWYAANEALVRDSASFPYALPLGTQFDWTSEAPSSALGIGTRIGAVPGVMAIDWMPTIGVSTSNDSAINIAAKNLYSFLRHTVSLTTDKDPADYMMYILAMDSLYSYYAWMVRAYGVIRDFRVFNRYTPEQIVYAMGINYADVVSNLAQFRYYINYFADKVARFAVPGDMTYIARHVWLNSQVFKDTDSDKAQWYMFNQSGYYVWTEVTSGPGYLAFEYAPFVNVSQTQTRDNNTKLTLSQIMAFGNKLYNALASSEDVMTMSGLILRAYGANNIYAVAPIAENYYVEPAYSLEVLSQIQNLSISGLPDTLNNTSPGTAANITQIVDLSSPNVGAIIQHLAFTDANGMETGVSPAATAAAQGLKRVLSLYKDNPTPNDTMVATRLMSIADVSAAQNFPSADASPRRLCPLTGYSYYGSEVVMSLRIRVFNTSNDAGAEFMLSQQSVEIVANLNSAAGTANRVGFLSAISAFDYHPAIYLLESSASTISASNNATMYGLLFDYNNFALLTSNDIRNMHETALLSEFSSPMINSLSSKGYNQK